MRWWRRIFARGDQSLGARGERLAAIHLTRLGYRILERNLRVGDDEADLLALDPDGRTIVIVEVKTRENDAIAPEASIGGIKQHRLNRLALHLQQQRRYRDHPFRFDAIAVVLPKNGEAIIRHIPGAFESRR